MWIDEAWRYDQTSRIDGVRGDDAHNTLIVRVARIAHEHDAISANAHISGAGLIPGTINELTVKNKQVNVLYIINLRALICL
jgi:hypothetical protein